MTRLLSQYLTLMMIVIQYRTKYPLLLIQPSQKGREFMNALDITNTPKSVLTKKAIEVTPTKRAFKIKDPGSAITHFIAMIGAMFAATPLIIKAYHGINRSYLGAFIIFIVSMIALYGASTTYHTFDISEKVNLILRKIDHAMIFVLIAGSYTPICLIVLPRHIGIPLLATVWAITVIGTIFKICWITCPHWVSSVLYIGMGWLVVFAFSSIMKGLSHEAFLWLLIGGIIYTIGGIIYALKLPILKKFNWKNFGNHELFHCFVMAGSLCHFIMVYNYLA